MLDLVIWTVFVISGRNGIMASYTDFERDIYQINQDLKFNLIDVSQFTREQCIYNTSR